MSIAQFPASHQMLIFLRGARIRIATLEFYPLKCQCVCMPLSSIILCLVIKSVHLALIFLQLHHCNIFISFACASW